MSLVEQAPWPADVLPYVYTEGKINTVHPVGLFVVDQTTLTPTLQAIQIGEFEGQLLVCVPHSVWHRTPSRRILPSNCLAKPTLVEVAGARPGNLSQEVEGAVVEVRIGYLRAQYYEHLEILEEYNAEFCFVNQTEELMLPLAKALCEVAQEHFAFFSADGGDLPGALHEEDIDGLPLDSRDVGLLEGDVSPVEARMSKMETALTDLVNEVKKMVASTKGAPKKKATPKAAGKTKAAPKVAGAPWTAAGDVAAAYPLLDRGVVASALQAGIPHSTLELMQKLVGQGTKASKVKDMNKKVNPSPLSEDEHVIEDEHYGMPEGSGLEPADPMTATLQKLTSIVEILTDDKKNAATSKLETALDGVASSSTDNPLQGTGKKAAAARRALGGAFQDHPEEIFGLIEKLMTEDLTSATVGPGMDRPLISARAWVERRSKINSFKTGAHAAWNIAGILDALMVGDVKKAKARAALGLMMLDQASIDRGSWVLASELSLETPPPFAVLATHQMPATQDGELPFSKLLDPRWSEIALSHLRDQDDYLQRRKTLGRMQKGGKDSNAEEGNDAEPKRRNRPKAKAKSQAAGSSADA